MREANHKPSFDVTSFPDLVTLDALELSTAIQERRVSCREVMAAYLDYIERVNPIVNAIVTLEDPGELMALADKRDTELAHNKYRGWLHGIPQAIKDLNPTKGLRTTLGSPLFRDHVPNADGIIAERAKRDGALIIGKTNTPEFGLGSQTYNTVFGSTRNAYDRTVTAGGSSGGAAAAMRMLPVADGSDMMGSLRNPAAYNNVIGFRPSFGRIPQGSNADVFFQQLATDGPMGRTVADVARLLDTQAGPDFRDPLSIEQSPRFARDLSRDFEDARIGWLGNWDGYFPMEPGVMELCERALTAFEDIGCRVENVLPSFAPERLWDTWLTLRHWSVTSNLGSLYEDITKRSQLKPEALWEIEGGLALTASDIYKASVARTQWYQALRQFFKTYDYLLLPSAQVFPFDVDIHWPEAINGVMMDTYHRWMEVVIPGSLSGCPVINMPVGFNATGLPMGLQIIGPHHADLAVLQLAHAYEQATGWVQKNRPPEIR